MNPVHGEIVFFIFSYSPSSSRTFGQRAKWRGAPQARVYGEL